MGGHQLPVIRDLAGLRIVGDMTLDEQDRVLLVTASAVGLTGGDVKVIDLPAGSERREILESSTFRADRADSVSRLVSHAEERSARSRQQALHVLEQLNHLLARDIGEGRR